LRVTSKTNSDEAHGDALRGFAPQHVELVSKDKDLGFQRSSRPEQSDQGAQVNLQRSLSGASISRFAVAVSRFGFAVGTTGSGSLPC
jgi:hypothetical protein